MPVGENMILKNVTAIHLKPLLFDTIISHKYNRNFVCACSIKMVFAT